MASGVDKCKLTAINRERLVRAEWCDESMASVAASKCSGRASDIQQLEWLLESPHLWSQQKANLEECQQWLVDNPHKRLSRHKRAWLDRVERAIQIGMRTGVFSKPKPKDPNHRPPWYDKRSSNLPPWMTDRSLLPKKPPGR